MTNKHIAYICADSGIPVYGNKGASIHVQAITRAYLRAGHRVTLFASCYDGPTPPGLEHIRTVPLPAPPKGSTLERAEAALAARAETQRLLAAHGPYDLIYERYSLWSDAGMAYAAATHTPGILEANAPLIEEQRTHRELVLPEQAAAIAANNFALAKSIIAVSPGVAAYLAQWPHQNIATIANGVDPAPFAAARENATRHDDHIHIGFLGTLKPWHGLPLLVDSFARVHAAEPRAHLHIIGDGPGRAELEQDLAARGLSACATLHGAIAASDVPAHLAALDIATAPYPQQENFYFSPLKIYEYLAAGLPVVTTRVGHLHEVVHHGEDGLLVPPDDPAAFAQALLELARDPARRSHMGQNGQARVAREHSWDAVAQQILALADA